MGVIQSGTSVQVQFSDTTYHLHTLYLCMLRHITLYRFITDIANGAKYPTDDWLTTFTVSHHALARLAYQSPIRKFYCAFILILIILSANHSNCRSQWPRGLRRGVCGHSPAEILGWSPTGGMDVCRGCCLLSGRGLWDELITRPEVCVFVCDLDTS